MKLSLSKRLLFAGTAMLLALGVVEGFLALVGVRPESYLPDAYVGFEGYTPLFEEWTDEEGEAVDAGPCPPDACFSMISASVK